MFVHERIQAFWDQLIAKNPEFEAVLRSTDSRKDPILLAGNGITRLGEPIAPGPSRRSPASSPPPAAPSWYGWIKHCWDEVNAALPAGSTLPPLPFAYAVHRGLTLPECIAYLTHTIKRAAQERLSPNALELLRSIYFRLWQLTEQQTAPSEVHTACVQRFRIIITTNYDTLLERACRARGLNLQVITIGARAPMAAPQQVWTRGMGHAERTIIKLHGSFPHDWIQLLDIAPDEAFDAWYSAYQGDDLIASVRGYRDREPAIDSAVKELTDQQLLRGHPLVILGYGMSPEDDLVLDLVHQGIRPPIKVSMTYGGDEVDEYRFRDQWGFTHLALPATRGGGVHARRAAHVAFIEQMRVTEVAGESESPAKVLTIGQASVNFVQRVLDAPARELAFVVMNGRAQPDSQKDEVLEARQIGGQALLPVTFFDRWDVRSALASIVGYDEYGLSIREHLERLDCVDWSYLVQDTGVVTEHSYATAFGNARTMVDSSIASTECACDEMLKRITADIKNERLNPSVLYLTKWHRQKYAPVLREWLESLRARPLVVYETGNWGGDPSAAAEDIGDVCDIVLSSSVFAMRVARLHLFSPVAKELTVFKQDPPSRADWDSKFRSYEREPGTRAYQYCAFGHGLEHAGLEAFHRVLFRSFPGARCWIVTLGEVGIMALSKDDWRASFWVPAPDEVMCNTLGCGDVARAAFVSAYISASLANRDDTTRTKESVKCAVAAGSLKGRYFRIDDAVAQLDWKKIDQEARPLTVEALSNPHAFAQMISKLTQP